MPATLGPEPWNPANLPEKKILLVSATPDVNLSLMNHKENHQLVQLENGVSYQGFKVHYSNERIIDDDEVSEVTELRNELEEHKSCIKQLRSELNEINLLNAKLLFTNKLLNHMILTTLENFV